MIIDVVLPLTLFLVGVIILFLYSRIDKKVDGLIGGQEFHLKHVIPLVLAIGVMVSVIMFIPEHALLGLFLFAYVAILFLFSFLLSPKWTLAVVPPVLFLFSFFYFWNIYTFNFFAILFGISVAIYMGSLFTWKTTVAFASLLTLMDIIQVLITGHMGEAFETAKALGVPAYIKLPMFPASGISYLGLGDLFLFGLLSLQSTRKYGRNFGFKSTILMALLYLLLQTVLLNYYPLENGFPATVLVTSSWLVTLGVKYLYDSVIKKKNATPQLD